MRRLVTVLAILVAAAVLVPSAGAAPVGQMSALYGAYLRATSALDLIERVQRDAREYPRRQGMTTERLLSIYDDLAADADTAFSRALDAMSATGDAQLNIFSAPRFDQRAADCGLAMQDYTNAVVVAAEQEAAQLTQTREVIVNGGTTQQILDTINGEPAAGARRTASDAKSPARRCTS